MAGEPRSFHDKFKFLVEIEGFVSAGFNKMSELSIEAAVIEYSEGGALIPNKTPGRLTFADITLERGATSDLDMYNWFQQVGNAGAMGSVVLGQQPGVGLPDPDYKRTLDIVQQDRDGATLRRWRVYGAWPNKLVSGEWDNDSDEKVIEMVTLSYDFYEVVQ